MELDIGGMVAMVDQGIPAIGVWPATADRMHDLIRVVVNMTPRVRPDGLRDGSDITIRLVQSNETEWFVDVGKSVQLHVTRQIGDTMLGEFSIEDHRHQFTVRIPSDLVKRWAKAASQQGALVLVLAEQPAGPTSRCLPYDTYVPPRNVHVLRDSQ